MSPFDTTPKTTRRAMIEKEIAKLLHAAPPERRIVYETAICTGCRKGELTALTVQDLDAERCTLKLAAKYCKGRKDSRQPIPAALAAKLKAVSAGKPLDAPLLEVDFHNDRLFARDLKTAKVADTGPGGDLVFHSLRHTFCSLVIESGASLTEAQRLLRHVDPRLTANVYSHARQDRLQSTAEAVGNKVIFSEKCATGVQRLAAGAEGIAIINNDDNGLRVVENGAGEGVRTCTGDFEKNEEVAKVHANNSQSSYEKQAEPDSGPNDTSNLSLNKKQPFEAQKYAQCMHFSDEVAVTQKELSEVVLAWPHLPEHIRKAIVMLVAPPR